MTFHTLCTTSYCSLSCNHGVAFPLLLIPYVFGLVGHIQKNTSSMPIICGIPGKIFLYLWVFGHIQKNLLHMPRIFTFFGHRKQLFLHMPTSSLSLILGIESNFFCICPIKRKHCLNSEFWLIYCP